MKKCNKCTSQRIAKILGHTSDSFNMQIGNIDYDGYVPIGFGIGGEDDIEFEYCLQCGAIQSDEFPVSIDLTASLVENGDGDEKGEIEPITPQFIPINESDLKLNNVTVRKVRQ